MEPLIQWYSDVKLSPMDTPSGFAWCNDGDNMAAGVLFDRDLSFLFPLLNAVVGKAVYLDQPPFLRFTFEKKLCALHPFYVAAFPFADSRGAEAYFERLISFFNDTHARRAEIRPNHTTYNPISVLEVIKLLPRTNCRECGYTTCMAFAAAIRMGRAVPQQCHALAEPVSEKAVYPVYDEQGNVVRTVSLDIDSSLVHDVFVRQKKTIASLEERLADFEARKTAEVVDYTPPFGLELSARELEVLRLVAHGATNSEIAGILGISHHTVKSHVISIFNKLGVNDRTRAAVWAARNGIL